MLLAVSCTDLNEAASPVRCSFLTVLPQCKSTGPTVCIATYMLLAALCVAIVILPMQPNVTSVLWELAFACNIAIQSACMCSRTTHLIEATYLRVDSL